MYIRITSDMLIMTNKAQNSLFIINGTLHMSVHAKLNIPLIFCLGYTKFVHFPKSCLLIHCKFEEGKTIQLLMKFL